MEGNDNSINMADYICEKHVGESNEHAVDVIEYQDNPSEFLVQNNIRNMEATYGIRAVRKMILEYLKQTKTINPNVKLKDVA